MEGDPNAQRLREDSDGDNIINLLEVEADWDAFLTNTSADSDSDGIPDYFEEFHFGTLDHDGSYAAVTDGLTLAEAYSNSTNPNSADSDGDGWTDKQELTWGWNPNYDQSRDDARYSQTGDFDGDGLQNTQEFTIGTNPLSKDTDGDKVNDKDEFQNSLNPNSNFDSEPDGLPDDWEIFYFGNLSQNGSEDTDDDGRSTVEEFGLGSNPQDYDAVDSGSYALIDIGAAAEPSRDYYSRPLYGISENGHIVYENSSGEMVRWFWGTASSPEVGIYPDIYTKTEVLRYF